MVDEARKKFIHDLANVGVGAIERLHSSKPKDIPRVYTEGIRAIRQVSKAHQEQGIQIPNKTLKERLNEFGWEKVQRGELPPEIRPEPWNFVQGVHQYDLCALNGVCAVAEDEADIVELCGIAKTSCKSPYEYERRAKLPEGTVVKIGDATDFLRGFKHLHSFRNRFLFVREERMNFQGIGERIEEAGELYRA